MSGSIESRNSHALHGDEAVPVVVPPASDPRDTQTLIEWFRSDEFQKRLTDGFWLAKQEAIQARDQMLQSDQNPNKD